MKACSFQFLGRFAEIASSFESVTAGVGAPKPSALNLSRFDVLVPRWRVSEWQFQLISVLGRVAYPLPVRIGHHRHLRLRCQKTLERSANAQILFAGFANDHG